MPRVLRKAKRRTAGLSNAHVLHVETGHTYFDDGFQSEDELREGWEVLRKSILERWAVEKPGHRPWAWWRYDAPERRRCLNYPHPHDVPGRPNEGLSRGLPSAYIPEFDPWGIKFETEPEYLARLGLLSDDEREALSRMEAQ